LLHAHEVAALLLGAVPGRLSSDASVMKRRGAEQSPAGEGRVANSRSLQRKPNQHLSPQSFHSGGCYGNLPRNDLF